MSRKATLENLFGRKTEGSQTVSDPGRVRTGAISAMGSSLKELTESAFSAAKLQEQIEAGATILELDPAQIDQSMVTDRLTADVDQGFDDLVESIRTSGQQVPILVRPSPDVPSRFQIAYGRRRMRAASKLGIKVRTIVRQLTDDELVIAQGKENLDRKDLSFIEKALFARRLEDQGFDRNVILAALSTDKGDLSRYISVAKTIPEDLAKSIGPASKAGRARWTALADKLPHNRQAISSVVNSEAFMRLDSDSRFSMLFNSLAQRPAPHFESWLNDRGQKAGRIERKKDQVVLMIDEKVVPAFGAYVVEKLDELYAEFIRNREEGKAA